ncbi:MAG: hypothetical protein GY862_18215 [Gammaproteobacteria bacterium]|nr:hypothetical protein [Gammaproteobacteria bacterium]
MKNIQIIDEASNCVYDIFSSTDEEFELIFPEGTDIAFIDEVYEREEKIKLESALIAIWKRRITKKEALGIHGILFYQSEDKKRYYPTRKDEEACNPDGSALRANAL